MKLLTRLSFRYRNVSALAYKALDELLLGYFILFGSCLEHAIRRSTRLEDLLATLAAAGVEGRGRPPLHLLHVPLVGGARLLVFVDLRQIAAAHSLITEMPLSQYLC